MSSGLFWGNATLDTILHFNRSGAPAEAPLQYGFSDAQLAWKLVDIADGNFVSDLAYLTAHNCSAWDTHSVELQTRPFWPLGPPNPWHSRTAADYAIPADSDLVVKHGFRGSFDTTAIGLLPSFPFSLTAYKVRDAYGLIHAEQYDRTSNLWTLVGQGLGSGTGSHFQKDPSYDTPAVRPHKRFPSPSHLLIID